LSAPLLAVDRLVKHFPIAGSAKIVQALNGVSFTVERGQTVSLVGESGSGKTTVGRCITGLLEATAGSIAFEGTPMGGQRTVRSRALRGRIQVVFQEPAESLDPRMTVGAIVAEPLIYLDTPRADRDRRAREALDSVGLGLAVHGRYPAELSAGVQQRVGIARAIVTRPDLIVLDEPTSALDPTARSEIVDLLRDLQRRLETAYVFISHDLSTVRYLSDVVVVLYLGFVAEAAPASQLFAEPSHPYSAGLLASVLLPHPSVKAARRVTLAGEIPSPIDLPPGCVLAGRCPFATDVCAVRPPPAVHLADEHLVHCFHHEQVLALGKAVDQFAQFEQIARRVLAV
jgi:oligopeptide/dipeptide ABC transporter ATP-binding protein